LAELHEVEASWKSWACVLLKPDGLYQTKPATEGNKPAKLKAIRGSRAGKHSVGKSRAPAR
jgi:DNA topoisomerase-3